jgi:DNA-binding ferritin-like protein
MIGESAIKKVKLKDDTLLLISHLQQKLAHFVQLVSKVINIHHNVQSDYLKGDVN